MGSLRMIQMYVRDAAGDLHTAVVPILHKGAGHSSLAIDDVLRSVAAQVCHDPALEPRPAGLATTDG